MQKLEITALRKDLWALDEIGKTVMYVINGSKKALLIDTGLGLSDLRETVRTLCGDKEILVVNTHGHSDHDSGNTQFRQVYMGRFDEPDGHSAFTQQDKESLSHGFFQEYLQSGGSLEGWNPGPAPRVIPVKDQDRFELGGYELTVLETPGHSLGSITLFEEKQGWMFTGDLMLTWEVWGQLERSTSLSVYGDSISRLATLQSKVQAVFPAHWEKNCGNPNGAPYELPPRVLSIYRDGIQSILDGKAQAEDYPYPALLGESGPVMKCSRFEIGGMVYDPARM